MTENIFSLNPDRELLIIGIVYVILSVVVFPVYALIIYVSSRFFDNFPQKLSQALHVRSDLRENISYKLINLINYCDVSQAFCHFLTGLFLIFPVFTDQIEFFVRVSTLIVRF